MTGLSACASSDDEWSGERTPSREAVDDVSEAKSEPEAAADDVPDAGPAAATDDVPKAEAEPEAAARANDKEAECRDYWLLDYDKEDKASNRREQKVFVLELNEDTENEEEGGKENCPTSADFEESAPRYDWTSIADVKDLFDLVAEQDPDSLSTEIVSNFVSVNPDPLMMGGSWKYGDYQSHPDFKHSIYQSDKTLTQAKAAPVMQGRAALLPYHEWQGFYQDQHLMTFGVCDAVDEEATVFFFDPDFIDEKYEYHKVWSEGSTVTQRSLPVPRFRFPYKAEDAVQQPQLLGIKIVDVATKQTVGAALIEVFVTQVKTEAGKPTTEAGKETEDLYACKFDLKITRTYDNKKQIPDNESAFRPSIWKDTLKIPNEIWSIEQLPFIGGRELRLLYSCRAAESELWVSKVRLDRPALKDVNHTLSYASETQSIIAKWTGPGAEFVASGEVDPSWYSHSELNPLSGQVSSDIHEFLATITNPNGELFQRTYFWIQTELSKDPENNEQICKFKITTLTHRPQFFGPEKQSIPEEELLAWFAK